MTTSSMCPLCMGNGWRINSYAAITDAICKACNGTGIVWAPFSNEIAERDALIASQTAKIAALREKVRLARMLSARLHLIHDDGRYVSVWTLSANAGRPYNGPTYEAELAALDAVLTPEERQP